MEKIKINIIYKAGKQPPNQKRTLYESDLGIVWQSKQYDSTKDVYNIGMNKYSLKNPGPNDSLYLLEPKCVLPSDYNLNALQGYKYIFTWANKAMPAEIKSKVVEVNHPSCLQKNFNNQSGNWLPWGERSNEIVFIANNKRALHPSGIYTLRLELADILHKNKYKVSWYGHMKLKKPYYKGTIPDKLAVLSKVRFSVCTENSYDEKFSHNYFTEKMPEVWFGGAVPIYMGCYNIDSFGFPKESYIDLRNFVQKEGKRHKLDFDKLDQTLKNFDKPKYKQIINSIKQNENKLYDAISYDKVYEKMIETFMVEKK